MDTPMNTSGGSLPLDTLPMEIFSPYLAASSLWLSELPYSHMEETVSELSVVSSQMDITQQPTWIIPIVQARSIVYESELIDHPTIGQIMRAAKPVSPREGRIPLVIVFILMGILTILTMMEIFYPYWLQ